jgi:hypothetical protein
MERTGSPCLLFGQLTGQRFLLTRHCRHCSQVLTNQFAVCHPQTNLGSAIKLAQKLTLLSTIIKKEAAFTRVYTDLVLQTLTEQQMLRKV